VSIKIALVDRCWGSYWTKGFSWIGHQRFLFARLKPSIIPLGEVGVIISNLLRSPPWHGWTLWNICVTNDHGYVPFVVNTSLSFPHSWLITGFVTRLTRWVSLVEQELLILPEHLSSPPVFSWVRVTRSLVLYVCFVDCCLSFCTFSFGYCVVCSSSIYTFWLPPFGIFKLFLFQKLTLIPAFLVLKFIATEKNTWWSDIRV
jgi:hypothetical protein